MWDPHGNTRKGGLLEKITLLPLSGGPPDDELLWKNKPSVFAGEPLAILRGLLSSFDLDDFWAVTVKPTS